MKTQWVLTGGLTIMAALIVTALIFPREIMATLNQPVLYPHALFVHVVSATLFFANAVVGMLWELRALALGQKEAILHTYRTVSWLDARFSTSLILLAVCSGLILAFTTSTMWEVGWLSTSFVLFLVSGVIWVTSDIPTQYRIRSLMAALRPEDTVLPPGLTRVLKLRWWISLGGILPLVLVFVLMIYKPDFPSLFMWLL